MVQAEPVRGFLLEELIAEEGVAALGLVPRREEESPKPAPSRRWLSGGEAGVGSVPVCSVLEILQGEGQSEP